MRCALDDRRIERIVLVGGRMTERLIAAGFERCRGAVISMDGSAVGAAKAAESGVRKLEISTSERTPKRRLRAERNINPPKRYID